MYLFAMNEIMKKVIAYSDAALNIETESPILALGAYQLVLETIDIGEDNKTIILIVLEY